MPGRRLPNWMNNETQSNGENIPNLDNEPPVIKFEGKIVVSSNENEASFLCNEMISQNRSNVNSSEKCVVGFDCEWDINNRHPKSVITDLVQICCSEDTVFLFHLARMNSFPTGLREIVENAKFIKTGVNVSGDVFRLQRQFNLSNVGSDVKDLEMMANKVLKSNQNWSLDRLCLHVLNKQLPKTQSIRCGNWSDFSLSAEQIKYAALDAYVSWKLYNCLENMN